MPERLNQPLWAVKGNSHKETHPQGMTNILGILLWMHYNRKNCLAIKTFMETTSKSLFVRHIALPQDHGSWVFLLSPLLIGLCAGARWSSASVFLILAALAAFLVRQPVTTAIKALSGRRSRHDLPAASFWAGIYALLGLGALAGLAWQGFGYLFYLALTGIPVFAWHLFLVSRRAERRQIGIEIVGSGVLALAAPAGLWVNVQQPDPQGWLLFGLAWLQSAGSIVYAYLRLEQRSLRQAPDRATAWQMGRRALLYTTFNLLGTTLLAFLAIVPVWLPVPYAVQWLETLWGITHPAVGVKPTRIGVRQLIVSSLFTLLFILAWNLPG